MARRRVNVKFLIILTAAVGTLVVAAVLTQRYVLRDDDPQAHLDRAAAQMAAGEYDAALKSYERAVGARQGDPDMWVTLGDAYFRLAGLDAENTRKAVSIWNRALEINPSHKPALTRLVRVFQYELDRTGPGQKELAQLVERTQQTATKLAEAERNDGPPDDPKALAAPHVVTLRAWVLGLPTTPQKVEQAIAGLTELAQQHPAEADLPYVAAGAMLQRAHQAFRDGRAADAEADRAKAEQLMTAAADAQPDNAEMQYRAGQLMTVLAGATPADAATTQAGAGTAATQPGGARQKVLARAEQYVRRAAELAKPDDEAYVQIQMAVANFTQSRGDREGAEKILRALIDRRDDDFDLDVRLALASQLSQDPNRRDDAIDLLTAESNLAAAEGERGIGARGAVTTALMAVINTRLDRYPTLTDDATRKTEAELIEKDIAQFTGLVQNAQDNPYVLKLRGEQRRVVSRDNVAAIQMLTRAKTLMEQQGTTRDALYVETLERLARANVANNQTGEAEKLLQQVLQRAPLHVPSHLLRAQLLTTAGRFEDAKPHVQLLEKLAPDHPDVIKLRLAPLLAAGQKEQAAALYAKLPEENLAQRRAKVQAALALGNRGEAVRVMEAILADAPGEPSASVALARLVAADDKARAAQLVDAAVKANPNNADLQFFQKQLAGATAEEMRAFRDEVIEGIDDPFAQTVARAQVARNEGNLDEALKQLKEAERQKPDDVGVMDALFELHAARGQWDEARRYADRLAKAEPRNALQYRFRLAMGEGKAEEALGHAQRFANEMPEFYQSWLALAQAEQATGRFERAVEHYQRALEKQTDNADALRGMIDSLLALGRIEDARQYVARAERAHGQVPLFREIAINFELEHGNADKAVNAREAMAKAQPEDAQAQLNLARTYLRAAEKKLSANQAQAAQGLLGNGMAVLEGGVAKFPDQIGFYQMLSPAALFAKRPEVAENAIKQLAARDAWKDRTEPAVLLADFYARAGRGADAEAVLRDLVGKRPQDVNLQIALAGLLRQQGKADEAAEVLDAANTDHRAVVRQRIELDLTAGRLDEAEKRLTAAIAAEPNNAELIAIDGFVQHARQRWDRAQSQLRKALEIAPDSAFANYYLGRVLLEQPTPDLAEAIRRLSRARELDPENVEALYALGVAHQNNRQPEEAVRAFEAALDRQPTNKGIRLALADVYTGAFAPPRWSDVERTLVRGREIQGFANDPDLLRAEAMMWARRKDMTKAQERIRAAVAAAPAAPQLVADLLAVLLEAKDFPGVIREADRHIAAAKDPNDPQLWWAYRFRGVARARGGDKDAAMKDLESALARAGAAGNEGAAQEVIRAIADAVGTEAALARVMERAAAEPRWLVMAAQLQGATSVDAAIATAEKASAQKDRLTPNEQARAMEIAAGLYLNRGDLQKARAAYLDLLALRPNDLGALNNMACLLAESTNPHEVKEALSYSEKAYAAMRQMGRRDPFLLDTHGWVLTLNDKLSEGIDLLSQAVAAANDSQQPLPEAHYHLAKAYLKARKQLEQAERQLTLASEALEKRASVNLSPVDAAAREALNAKIQAARQEAQQAKADQKTATAQ